MRIDFLKKLGLSAKESSIYVALLEYTPLTIATISKVTGLHRPAIYKELPQLIKKGLVAEIVTEKKKVYKAESPKKLQKLVDNITTNAEQEISELKDMYDEHRGRPTITYLRGIDGFKRLFDDVATTLNRGDEFLRYSSRKVDERYFTVSNLYKKKRITKQIERRVITSEAKAKKKKPRLERWVKFIPGEVDLFDDNISQIIYKDKVAFIDHDTNSTFIMESKKMATFQRKIFNLLWKRLDN